MDLCAKLSTGLAQSEETIAEQQREIERLRSAFANYGLHLSRCQVWKNGDLSAVTKCTCGLDEAPR